MSSPKPQKKFSFGVKYFLKNEKSENQKLNLNLKSENQKTEKSD